MQTLYEYGGVGPVLHFAPANGFPPGTYIPMLRSFMAHYRALCVPPRALWPGQPPPAQVPQQAAQWNDTIALDLLDGLRAYDLQGVVAVGHSFGAVASILAALKEPQRFKALVLLDPTILPPEVMAQMVAQGTQTDDRGSDLANALAERAEKRRDYFESPDAAYEYFKGKRLFADWPEETLRLYAQSLRPLPEGGFTLAWPRAWEAYYFRTFYTGTWQHIPALNTLPCPILVLRGGESDTFLPQAATHMQALLPQATYEEIPGHGHLFPHSAPQESAAHILSWLAKKL